VLLSRERPWDAPKKAVPRPLTGAAKPR
jgi:hypothetical protein